MSIVENSATKSPTTAPSRPVVLHRIREVRRRQGVSLRAAAKRIGCELGRLREQECGDADISLSELYGWQRALGVPIQELLVDCGERFSVPVLELSRMVRLAKTIATIRERCQSKSDARLAKMLTEQLSEIMPTLSDVGPWPTTRLRALNDLGQVCERRLSEDALRDGG